MTEVLKGIDLNDGLNQQEIKKLQTLKLKGLDKQQLDSIKKGLDTQKDKVETKKNLLDGLGDKVISPKSNPDDIKKLQKLVGVNVDGKYGPQTKEAVKLLQEKVGTKTDGIYGPKTYTAATQHYESIITEINIIEGKITAATNNKKSLHKHKTVSKQKLDVNGKKETQKGAHKVEAHKVEALTATEAENKFDKRLENALNSDTTTILTLGNQVMVMQFDNANQKNEADKIFLSLEKGFSNDKDAAYAVLSFVKKYKDNIKSISDIYKEAGKGLYGNQIVFAEDDSEKQKALLDAAENKDVNVIDVGTGSVFGNVFIKTFTLGFGGDTANVSGEKLTDGLYGHKMSSTELFKGYHIGDSFDGTGLQKPLGHFEKSEVISNIADKIEDLFSKANDGELTKEDKQTPEYKIAIEYKKYLNKDINSSNSLATKINKKDLEDDAIKSWLKNDGKDGGKHVIDSMITKDPVIEITKDGFMKVNPDQAIGDKEFVKVQLDGVNVGTKTENKEILMKASKLDYNSLGFDDSIKSELASMPPIVLEDGTMFAFGKEGMYVLGKDIGNGADAVKDYIARHQVVAAAIGGGIIGALLAKGRLPELHLNLSGLGKGLEKLAHNIGHATDKAAHDVKDVFKNIDLKSLNNLFGGYLLTAIPMNYKIEGLERELAEMKGKYEGSNSIKAEIDAIMNNNDKLYTEMKGKYEGSNSIKAEIDAIMNNNDKLYTEMIQNKDLFNQTEELQNRYAHFILVKNGFAKPGELTALDFSAHIDNNDNITITAQGNEDNKILVGGKELYIPDGKELTIKLLKNGNIDSINGQINISVDGKDNYVKFNGNGTVGDYYEGKFIGKDKEIKSGITITSIDDIIKYTSSSKKETKEMKDSSYTAKQLESIIDSGIESDLQKYLDGDGSSHTKGFVDDVRYDKNGNLQFDINITGSWSDLSVKVKSKNGENPSEADIINAVNDKLKKHFLDANE